MNFESMMLTYWEVYEECLVRMCYESAMCEVMRNQYVVKVCNEDVL